MVVPNTVRFKFQFAGASGATTIHSIPPKYPKYVRLTSRVPTAPSSASGAPPLSNCLRPRLRRGPRRQAGPDESREARLRSGKAAAPPGWALERATGVVQRRDGGVADRPAAAVLSAARSDGEMRVASETPGKAEERCSGQTPAAATWRDTPTRRRRSLLPRPNWSSSQHEPGGAQRPEAP